MLTVREALLDRVMVEQRIGLVVADDPVVNPSDRFLQRLVMAAHQPASDLQILAARQLE